MPADPALLTPSQRAFLRGEKEYEHEQSEKDMRYKIRQRVRNGLFDLALLWQHMDARDRRQLFKDVRAGQLRDDDATFEDEVYREDESTALVYAVAFLYQVAADVDFDFEKVLELAAVARQGENPDNPFAARSVDVTIDERLVYDYDRIRRKVEQEQSLSEPEYLAMTRLFLSDLERFTSVCRKTDLDVQAKLDAGEQLTKGEAVVAFGKAISSPTSYDRDDLRDHIPDRVASALGFNLGR